MKDIERIDPSKRLSPAVIHNGLAYLTGQVAADATAGISGQTEQVLAKIDRLLQKCGTDKSRMLSAQVWLADIADFDAMNAVWEKWVEPCLPPARATVQACLARPELKVEIKVIAAI
ncbi:MAG: RidA family protein [Parvibaculaceae bacterium]